MTSPAPAAAYNRRLVGWLSVPQLITWGGVFYTFARLMAPLERELGLTRAQSSLAFNLARLAASSHARAEIYFARLFVVLVGLGNGMLTIVKGTAIAQSVSRSHVASLNGALSLPSALGCAAGPLGLGLLCTPAAGYTNGLWLLLAASVLAVVALLLAQRGATVPA
jgi:hypothetical protein